MKKELKRISIRSYAKHLGIDHKSVSKAIEIGKIKKGVAYKPQIRAGKRIEVPEIILEIADKEWGFTHKTGKVKPGQKKIRKHDEQKDTSVEKLKPISPHSGEPLTNDTSIDTIEDKLILNIAITADLPYNEVVRRREIIELVMAKKKLQEVDGILVRRDLVEKSLFAFGTELKKSLFNMPARIAGQIRCSINDIEAQNIIHDEIRDILSQFSNIQEVKLIGE